MTNPHALWDDYAVSLARLYAARLMAFDDCSAAINAAYNAQIEGPQTIPPVFWRIYAAFDEGEALADGQNIDRGETITRPQVMAILREIGQNHNLG